MFQRACATLTFWCAVDNVKGGLRWDIVFSNRSIFKFSFLGGGYLVRQEDFWGFL